MYNVNVHRTLLLCATVHVYILTSVYCDAWCLQSKIVQLCLCVCHYHVSKLEISACVCLT